MRRGRQAGLRHAKLAVAFVLGWALASAWAATVEVASAKKGALVPISFDKATLTGELPAQEQFLDPKAILKGKSSPRGKLLFRGEQQIVEVYADDEVRVRVDEPFAFDEFIHIISGTLTLTDAAGAEHKYAAGDQLMVPKGFTGIWHHSPGFRELVVIEREAYEAAYATE